MVRQVSRVYHGFSSEIQTRPYNPISAQSFPSFSIARRKEKRVGWILKEHVQRCQHTIQYLDLFIRSWLAHSDHYFTLVGVYFDSLVYQVEA